MLRDHRSSAKGSPLDNLLEAAIPLPPHERTLALESSSEIEVAHAAAGAQGSTSAPDATEEVEHHYICFVRSPKDKYIYEMNGTAKGPIKTDIVQEEEDLLSEDGIKLVQDHIKLAGGGGNVGFSLLALVPK